MPFDSVLVHFVLFDHCVRVENNWGFRLNLVGGAGGDSSVKCWLATAAVQLSTLRMLIFFFFLKQSFSTHVNP